MEVIFGTAGLYDFEVKKHTEYHYSLFHQSKGRFDYWPSTSKGMWIKNGKQGQSFKISNIEEFIEENFNSKL